MDNLNGERLANEVAIAEAAPQNVFFERSSLFESGSRIDLGFVLARHKSASAFAPVHITTTVRNFQLQNVTLDSDTMTLLQGNRLISETAYLIPKDSRSGIHARDADAIKLNSDEDYVIGCNKPHWAYYHWLTQCLPAIDQSLSRGAKTNIRLILPKLKPWQQETLEILGHGEVPRLELLPAMQYLIPRAQYSQYLYGSTSFGLSRSVLATSRRLSNGVAKRNYEHNIIYVPCTNPYYGRLANEPQLVDCLRRQGVFIFDRSVFPLVERINIFRNAKVVIAPHGEGLTDILFCEPGTLIWELMPEHHQSSCYNRLAQMAHLDYWGDMFEAGDDVVKKEWKVEFSLISRNLSALSQRFVITAKHDGSAGEPKALLSDPKHTDLDAMPIDDLMLGFESLGDNCEFGLVQRHAKAEPLGLLRFAGFFVPVEQRLNRLVAALKVGFEQLGAPNTVEAHLAGEPGRREFMIKEKAYNLMYHTFMHEGQIEPDKLEQREYKRLGFLRRKLVDDLRTGEKIWVWKSTTTTELGQVTALAECLRRHGPNVLLWVVEADPAHRAGTVERIDDGLFKGYVEKFAPLGNATDISPLTWFMVCQNVYNLNRAINLTDKGAGEAKFPCTRPQTAMEHFPAAQRPLVPRPQLPPTVWWRSLLQRVLGRGLN